ncbi:MAG TPA: hypothetical protein VHS55_09370 [Solirubrobacteraceae bacterium]|jgi:hypothetical protein|nr:hypothetical protein [Solirubrobacteraceae bacterium]
MTDSTAEAQAQPQSPAQPSEEELRAAYEAELNRITSADLLLQTAASLLNLGARRLGLTGAGEAERDLGQVRDAIDGVRALIPILERCSASEVGPLRDALSQLQMAYAREAPRPAPGQTSAEEAPAAPGAGTGAAPGTPAQPVPGAGRTGQSRQPGPAESSGRLWVPGR